MKKVLLALILIPTFWVYTSAQKSPLRFNFTIYDFGDILGWKNQPAIFTFQNTGKTEVLFLPTFPKDDILVELPGRRIQPGESANIEVYYFTGKTGDFKQSVPVYINSSKEPITLTVKGNILSLDKDAFVQCPGFAPKSDKPEIAEQQIKVIDKNTREPIYEAVVILKSQNGQVQRNSDRQGTVKEKLTAGLYNFSAEKYGYETTAKTQYINKPEGVILLELEPIKRETPSTSWETYREQISEERNDEYEDEKIKEQERLIRYGLIPDPNQQPPAVSDPETTPVTKSPEPKMEFVEEDEPKVVAEMPMETTNEARHEETVFELPASPPVLKETPVLLENESPVLSVERYNPNNIVFLIDVSSSMKSQNKLPLLKTSMKQLTEVLREVDIITVITYSSSAQVALASTTADNKAQIMALIDSLTPAGWTHGVKGIQTAYEMLEANFLSGGNNQVILATDGLFNNPTYSENELFSLVREKSLDNLKLSVIGFGDDDDADRMMRKLSDRGNGSFLKIKNPAEADQILIEEIKLHSLKH